MKQTESLCLALLLATVALALDQQKPGVQDADVKIPLAKLVPEAKFEIPGSPDWIAIGDDVWISNLPKNSVSRLDPRTNKVKQVITGLSKPCSGLAIGFGSLWVPNCGNHTLSRIDLNSGKIQTQIETGIADAEGGFDVGAGSVWLLTDKKGTLARIDPRTNRVTKTIVLPGGCHAAAFGYESLWVSCTEKNNVIRVDPSTNRVLATIPVGPRPRFLTVGEGGVWTLNQGDGSITRISPSDNRVLAIIAVGIPGGGGDISEGEGSVWATSFGFPVSRIDPATNKVAQQFVGEGGDAIRAGRGSVWLSNYKLGSEWRLDPHKIALIR
jgi:DNA-binding beta-propeller fold protein YncE